VTTEPRDPRDRIAQREEAGAALEEALHEIKRVIVGQDAMLERLLVSLVAGGHVLLEGVPGLAKTLTVKTLARVLGGSFRRIQFTPDLVPADLVGTRIYRPDTGRFDVELGPVFGNFLLADEINRAPAKVQSALLEVMQEQQVTIGGETFKVPHPFLVLATQNPIEAAGTYPLPEAQVDRFLMRCSWTTRRSARRPPWWVASSRLRRTCASASRCRTSSASRARLTPCSWTAR
jgi:MoxR-like ATPase